MRKWFASALGILLGRNKLKQRLEEREERIAALEARTTELQQFVYTLSHDLEIPLATIQGSVGFLRRDIASGNKRHAEEDVERIAGATALMERQLDGILTIANLENVDATECFRLDEVVWEAVDLVIASEDRHRFAVEVMQGMPMIVGDRSRLVDAFVHLVENAVKFMGSQEQPRIEIGGCNTGGSRILCFVRDNGTGIEPRDQEKVFGLFNKAEAEGPGTGIGLAFVRRIIEAHEGQIWVESTPGGGGTTFFFTLSSPLMERPVASIQATASSSPSKAAKRSCASSP